MTVWRSKPVTSLICMVTIRHALCWDNTLVIRPGAAVASIDGLRNCMVIALISLVLKGTAGLALPIGHNRRDGDSQDFHDLFR